MPTGRAPRPGGGTVTTGSGGETRNVGTTKPPAGAHTVTQARSPRVTEVTAPPGVARPLGRRVPVLRLPRRSLIGGRRRSWCPAGRPAGRPARSRPVAGPGRCSSAGTWRSRSGRGTASPSRPRSARRSRTCGAGRAEAGGEGAQPCGVGGTGAQGRGGGASTYPSCSPASISRALKKAIRGKRRSWCDMKTRTGTRLGSQWWLMKRLTLP